MRPKPAEKAKARMLRAQGVSMKRIASRVGVSVNSVYRWTTDIKLSPEQIERNRSGPTGPQGAEAVAARARRWSEVCRERRREYQAEGRRQASRGGALHEAGCMLYWAEGKKGRNRVSMCNSDVRMLEFFRRFLTTCFGVSTDEFRLSLHVYLGNGLSIEDIEQHWLDALQLPRSCLRKHSINPLPTSSSGQKKNKLPYGVCTLELGSTRIVQHIYGAIQEYGGFEEPRWLD